MRSIEAHPLWKVLRDIDDRLGLDISLARFEHTDPLLEEPRALCFSTLEGAMVRVKVVRPPERIP